MIDCASATIVVDDDDSEFASMPAISHTYTTGSALYRISWNKSDIYTSNADSSLSCGDIDQVIVDMTSGAELPIDGILFKDTFNPAWNRLDINSNNGSDGGLYTLRLKVSYTSYPSVSAYKDFYVLINGDCSTSVIFAPNSPLSEQTYYVGSAQT